MRLEAKTRSPGRVLGLLALLLALGGHGCGDTSEDAHGSGDAEASSTVTEEDGDEESIPVEVAPVRREPLSSLYSTSATLRRAVSS